jgi:CrcB protein
MSLSRGPGWIRAQGAGGALSAAPVNAPLDCIHSSFGIGDPAFEAGGGQAGRPLTATVDDGAAEMIYLWVFIGSALGGMARYWATVVAARRFGETFPWGTIMVNISGSFLIALLGALAIENSGFPASPDLRAFTMAGFCGGYTTVSSFALQTLLLAHGREWRQAAANVVISVVFCTTAAWLGFGAGAVINHAGGG